MTANLPEPSPRPCFDRPRFFAAVRTPLFGTLASSQADGCEAILAEAERRGLADTRALAYMLATVFWETARTMQPVREIGRGRGKPYGTADPHTSHAYYGRGLVQLTWKANYAALGAVCGLDLVAQPDLALRLAPATAILFEGMGRGLFTGKKLADYFHPDTADWVGARRIVNGQDRAEAIAGYARRFDAALRAAADDRRPRSAAPPRLADRLRRFFHLAPRT